MLCWAEKAAGLSVVVRFACPSQQHCVWWSSVFWEWLSNCRWETVNALLVLLWLHLQLLPCLGSCFNISLWVFSLLSFPLSGHPAAQMWVREQLWGLLSCRLGLSHNSWGPRSAGTLECDSSQRLSRKLSPCFKETGCHADILSAKKSPWVRFVIF